MVENKSNMEKFYDLIEDGEFTKKELDSSGLTQEQLFELAKEAYGKDTPLNVIGEEGKPIIMTFDAGIAKELVDKMNAKGRGADSAIEQVKTPDELKKMEVQQEVEELISDIKNTPGMGLPVDVEGLSEQQKMDLVEAYIDSNSDLLEIATMSAEERKVAMDDVKAQLEEMGWGVYIKQQNGELLSPDEEDALSRMKAEALKDNPDLARILDRYNNLRTAEDERGNVQGLVKELERFAPKVLRNGNSGQDKVENFVVQQAPTYSRLPTMGMGS